MPEEGELKPKDGENSIEFKKRIEAKIAENKAKQKEVAKAAKEVIKTEKPIESTPSQESAQKNKTGELTKSISQPIPKSGEELRSTGDESQVDYLEWANKKGYKTPEDMARALREKDREFHEKRKEELKGEAPSPQPAPPPNWAPIPQPPSYPYSRQDMIEQYAEQYGMLPRDFERVLQVASDISEAKIARVLKDVVNPKLSKVERETEANSELRNLMLDPLFADPEVQYEMHRIMDEDASLFEGSGRYAKVFQKSLENIARRNLQGQGRGREGGREIASSNRPPTMAGSGSGSSPAAGAVSPQDVFREKFSQAKTAEEKRKLLESVGAIRTSY